MLSKTKITRRLDTDDPIAIGRSVSIAGRSPGLAAETIEAVVTLPTFKRPEQVLATLASLKAQQTARRFAVIVMENEAEARDGAKAALPLFERGEIAGMVIIAHERGNCSAYNAGWHTAIAQFPDFRHLLVIDDDEIADPNWLERMCKAAETLGAEIVGGPQVPVFPEPAHARWAEHPVFAPPYRQTGPCRGALFLWQSAGRTQRADRHGAALPRPQIQFHGRRRFRFPQPGGAEGLRARLVRRGEGPGDRSGPRVEADWIRARSLRNGVISTLVEKKKRAGTPLAGAKVLRRAWRCLPPRRCAACGAAGAGPDRRRRRIYPVYVALGRVLAEFGYANEQYRQPEKN